MRLSLLSLTALCAPPLLAAQAQSIPVTASAWTATDSVRSETYLGRPSLYIDRGIALANGVTMTDGTIELDVATAPRTNFLGVVFRAADPKFANVIFLRPGASGTEEAVQYGPAFHSLGVAWQVYHGAGANAVATIPRGNWVHVKIELAGEVARLYLDTATTPTLVVPHVVMSGGTGIGVWTGAFGRGAYFSNLRYTPAAPAPGTSSADPLPVGTIQDWELSESVPVESFMPTRLPDLRRMHWDPVSVEPEGFVLVNRYREAPVGGIPVDSTGRVLTDSVMTGRMAGERVVYARATITAARAGLRRLQYAYNNGVVIYLNGTPLVMAMNPGGLRRNLGVMERVGDAVYLPLKKGRNDLVFAVVDLTGGWAYSARLDP